MRATVLLVRCSSLRPLNPARRLSFGRRMIKRNKDKLRRLTIPYPKTLKVSRYTREGTENVMKLMGICTRETAIRWFPCEMRVALSFHKINKKHTLTHGDWGSAPRGSTVPHWSETNARSVYPRWCWWILPSKGLDINGRSHCSQGPNLIIR